MSPHAEPQPKADTTPRVRMPSVLPRSRARSGDEESRIDYTTAADLAPSSGPKPRLRTPRIAKPSTGSSPIDEKKEPAEKFFDRHIIPSTPCAFLCWGPPERCRIISVPLGGDGAPTFQKLQDGWYARRGTWRRWLPLFSIVCVEPVQVSMRISRMLSSA